MNFQQNFLSIIKVSCAFGGNCHSAGFTSNQAEVENLQKLFDHKIFENVNSGSFLSFTIDSIDNESMNPREISHFYFIMKLYESVVIQLFFYVLLSDTTFRIVIKRGKFDNIAAHKSYSFDCTSGKVVKNNNSIFFFNSLNAESFR